MNTEMGPASQYPNFDRERWIDYIAEEYVQGDE
jgi:hypothetical protein